MKWTQIIPNALIAIVLASTVAGLSRYEGYLPEEALGRIEVAYSWATNTCAIMGIDVPAFLTNSAEALRHEMSEEQLEAIQTGIGAELSTKSVSLQLTVATVAAFAYYHQTGDIDGLVTKIAPEQYPDAYAVLSLLHFLMDRSLVVDSVKSAVVNYSTLSESEGEDDTYGIFCVAVAHALSGLAPSRVVSLLRESLAFRKLSPEMSRALIEGMYRYDETGQLPAEALEWMTELFVNLRSSFAITTILAELEDKGMHDLSAHLRSAMASELEQLGAAISEEAISRAVKMRQPPRLRKDD